MEEQNLEHEHSTTTTLWIEQEVRRLAQERDHWRDRWHMLKAWLLANPTFVSNRELRKQLDRIENFYHD